MKITQLTHKPLRSVASVFLLSSLWVVAGAVSAQTNYPEKPVHFIVPFTAGGQYDTVARLIAKPLSDVLGQPVVVENIGGAGGVVGGAKAASAAPDGYTFLAYGGNYPIAQFLYKDMKFDPINDFEPITGVSLAPHAFLVNADLPVNNLQELLAYSKANPGTLNYASPGVGSTMNIVFEEVSDKLGIDATHVPYKGGSQVLTDLAGGQVQAGIIAVAPALPLIEAGKIRAIAVTSQERSPNLPDVPTVAESAIPGYESGSWLSIVVPKGTPADVREKLWSSIQEVMKQPQVAQALTSQSFALINGTPEQLKERIDGDATRFGPIIKRIQEKQ